MGAFVPNREKKSPSPTAAVEAARAAAASGGPTIGAACLATAAGFLALQLSPTPMVRSFALLLLIGIGIAFLPALTAGFAALSLRRNGIGGNRSSGGWRWGGGPPRRGGASSAEHRGGGRTDRTRPPERLLSLALSRPRLVLGVGLALALVGWGVGTQIETVSDIRSLAPQSLPAVRSLTELQNATGVSGELDVSVTAPNLADPATIEWMAAFKQRVLRSNGFRGENPSCLDADVCPGPALSDFLTRGGGELTSGGIRETLSALSSYDLRQVAPIDPRTGRIGHAALLSFGIRAQSLEDQQALIDRVRAEIGKPGSPGGPTARVTVHLAGLPVIAAGSATDPP